MKAGPRICWKPWTSLLVCLVVLSLATGCGTMKAYEGPDLPREEIAVVSAGGLFYRNYVFGGSSLQLTRVDGKRAESIRAVRPKSVKVLPGPHRFGVTYRYGHIFSPSCALGCDTTTVISFDTEAGHEYRIEAEYAGSFYSGPLHVWAVDKTTGKVVARVKGGKFEGQAEYGDAEAMQSLAVLYQREGDADKASKWLSKLMHRAETGDAEAQFQLSVYYHRTEDEQAQRWWRCQAAQSGHAVAQFVHARGERDYAVAYMWYTLAAANGHPNAAQYAQTLSDRMTAGQIAEAERLVREWKPGSCELEGGAAPSTG